MKNSMNDGRPTEWPTLLARENLFQNGLHTSTMTNLFPFHKLYEKKSRKFFCYLRPTILWPAQNRCLLTFSPNSFFNPICIFLPDRLGEGPALNPILVEYPESLWESCGEVLEECEEVVDVIDPVVPPPPPVTTELSVRQASV